MLESEPGLVLSVVDTMRNPDAAKNVELFQSS
jgi:hypothetical protein